MRDFEPETYNRAMRALTSLLLLSLATVPAWAQNNGQNAAPGTNDKGEKLLNQEQTSNKAEQKTERIRHEDKGGTIEELRVGGQTRSITVQPSNQNAPAYEVKPSDGVRNRPLDGDEATTNPRVWNLKKF